jgi:exodeoxyribonuclease VII small subunit
MSEKSNETVAKKLAKLSELVAWFESDDFVLEEAVERFKDAEKLAGDIERDLAELKNEITVLKKKFDED